MSMRTTFTSLSFSHLSPSTATVVIGDEESIVVDAASAYNGGALDWTAFRTAALTAMNAVLTGVVRPHIDGIGIGVTDAIPDWVQPIAAYGLDGRPNAYRFGVVVRHNSNLYESLVDWNVWEPGTPNSSWIPYGDGIQAWANIGAPGYSIGNVVSKGTRVNSRGETVARVFESQVNGNIWDPVNTNSYWLEIADEPLPYRYIGNIGYREDMRVTDVNHIWRATANGAGASSFPPSMVGTNWLDEGEIL